MAAGAAAHRCLGGRPGRTGGGCRLAVHGVPLLLERLSPVERAVFLLRDVFAYGFDEVAAIVGKSEPNCRQLVSRARRHISEEGPRFEASRAARDQLANRFFAAVGDGNMDELVSVLAADVVVYGDSGGRPPSWQRLIVGEDNVSRLMYGLGEQMRQLNVEIRPTVNGQSGALVLDAGGRLINVFSVDIADGAVRVIRSVINPTSCGTSGRWPISVR